MDWNESRSMKRIKEHLKTVPQFDDHITLAKHVRAMAEDRKSGLMGTSNNDGFRRVTTPVWIDSRL
jgi:hypothetical protein